MSSIAACPVCHTRVPMKGLVHPHCAPAHRKLEAAENLLVALDALLEGVSFSARAGGYDRDTGRELGVFELVCSDVEGNRIDAARDTVREARAAGLGATSEQSPAQPLRGG